MSKKCINENNWESKALESRLVTVSAVDNQELTEVNIFTSRKNNTKDNLGNGVAESLSHILDRKDRKRHAFKMKTHI